ncbi:50S ribosomal protein L6 [Patescibacteria group bacterium]|nr:50S ribosomal protein L6 [Patescibacteria group bacterium]MDE2021439.1 50S ribosomal protein L6 [Patescibacteria group bacterium]MDE2172989.1 50S ribosomal protein L6 [Patescibacteria group bacterium]
MSRLAKKPIAIGKTAVSVEGGVLSVKGTKGVLTKRVHPSVAITVGEEGVTIVPKDSSRLAKALTGTFASHVRNMVAGVETTYVKKLILEGVGYRVEVKGKDVILAVGFSHPVALRIPEDVSVTVEKNVIKIESANKESVGQFAANIRRIKPPEPYLGKGIRYEGEVILRKQGKKAA